MLILEVAAGIVLAVIILRVIAIVLWVLTTPILLALCVFHLGRALKVVVVCGMALGALFLLRVLYDADALGIFLMFGVLLAVPVFGFIGLRSLYRKWRSA